MLANIKESYLEKAELVARVVDAVLQARAGTDPAMITRWVLARGESGVWLFAVLDDRQLAKPEPYEDAVHHLSSSLRGMPVFFGNHTGFRLSFLLTKRPQLPKMVTYPGWKKGVLQLGVNGQGKAIEIPWNEIGHMLIAGMTRFGKSTVLRLITIQAQAEGWLLALSDPSRTTFSMFKGSGNLVAPIASTPDQCSLMLGKVAEIIEQRSKLFDQAAWMPDTLAEYNAKVPDDQKLPPVLVVVDEYNGTVSRLGGASGAFAKQAAQIVWDAGKYGVWMVLAGQDWSKDVVGAVREQMMTRICLKVANPAISRMIVGRPGAELLDHPGKALTNRWGTLQMLYVEKQASKNPSGLTDEEQKLAAFLQQKYKGRMTIAALQDFGMTERLARRTRVDCNQRGRAVVRPEQDNALCITVPTTQRAGASGLDGSDTQKAGLDAQAGSDDDGVGKQSQEE